MKNRKWQLIAALVLILLVAGTTVAYTQGGTPVSSFDIRVTDATLTLLNDRDGDGQLDQFDTFLVIGTIIDEHGRKWGTYYSWGVWTSGFEKYTDSQSFVQQRFAQEDGNTILGIGTEVLWGEDLMAVAGGTNGYRGITGSYSKTAGAPRPFGDGNLVYHFDIKWVHARRQHIIWH